MAKLDNIIVAIKKIIYEIDNPRNDGWTKDHYIKLLIKIKKIVDDKLSSL